MPTNIDIAGKMFPPEYYRTIFAALHGSWNRDQKIGYRVDAVRVNPNGTATSQFIFASGWLQGQDVWGAAPDCDHGIISFLFLSVVHLSSGWVQCHVVWGGSLVMCIR